MLMAARNSAWLSTPVLVSPALKYRMDLRCCNRPRALATEVIACRLISVLNRLYSVSSAVNSAPVSAWPLESPVVPWDIPSPSRSLIRFSPCASAARSLVKSWITCKALE